MNSIDIMVAEHDKILFLNQVVRNACFLILKGNEVCVEDFRTIIDFTRTYADKHHHGKEEQILFQEMKDRLGAVGTNLITHGMLVEHDLGRLFISELEEAINQYENTKKEDIKLDIIANAIGYTKLLKRHIEKENEVVYTFGAKNLPKEIFDDVNARTEAFEKQAEAEGIQKKYTDILKTLMDKYDVK